MTNISLNKKRKNKTKSQKSKQQPPQKYNTIPIILVGGWQSTEENVIMCPDLSGEYLKSSQELSMNVSQSLHS